MKIWRSNISFCRGDIWLCRAAYVMVTLIFLAFDFARHDVFSALFRICFCGAIWILMEISMHVFGRKIKRGRIVGFTLTVHREADDEEPTIKAADGSRDLGSRRSS